MTRAETHILVADEQRNVRDNLKMILENAGYHADATADGQEVLARIHGRHYDIAFIDLNMTKITGLDLIRFIRALSKRTTVVTLSQFGLITKVVEAMKLGAIDFLEKPVDPRKTQLLCDEILRRSALTSNETLNELRHSAELALERNDSVEARIYLKTAILRDENRPAPYYLLSQLCEAQGDIREALHYYCRAIDAGPTFQLSHKALFRLKQLATGTRASWDSGNIGASQAHAWRCTKEVRII
jgi:DNA-binding response OmpR family regulator